MSRSVSVASGAVQVAYASFECEEDFASEEFQDCLYNVQGVMQYRYPSLSSCDVWLDREDHAILENYFAYIGVSEYCGLVSVWIVPKEAGGYHDEIIGMAPHWCSQVRLSLAAECFGTRLNKLGNFSNGEGVFEAAK